MPVIRLSTTIRAPAARCFDLARSIDFHVVTATASEERAIGGRTSGLIALGEEVTWSARHFGVRQRMTVRLTGFDEPRWFQDAMVRGPFQRMTHDHHFDFDEVASVTTMRDTFDYASPLG